MSVKESIIMTASDREPILLANTIRWLASSDLEESEIIIVDDYSLREPVQYDTADGRIRTIHLDPYECFKLEPNYNNPAHAFNVGLEEAQGERVVLLSSDVIVPPRVMKSARASYDGTFCYCPMVIDLATSMEYCGPHRVFPMPWFLYANREACIKAGGWDEAYLDGLCWEDNDFVGRLALTLGKFVFDWSAVVWHQSHFQPAYQDTEEVRAANKRNEKLTMDKWTALPWAGADALAFEVVKGRHEGTGSMQYEFKDFKGIKDKVIASTVSPFVKVPA